MLAAVGTGVVQDVPAAVGTFTSTDRCYGPSASRAELYDALYEYYRSVIDAMGPIWKTRQRVLSRINERVPTGGRVTLSLAHTHKPNILEGEPVVWK